MTGGLMNLTAAGNENIVIHGNPKKTFFKAVFKKHTNFGLQRFRIDFEGNRVLNFTTPTILDFKVPRYAELLYDTYVCVTLPHIYSPLLYKGENELGRNLIPYEFRWIDEIGTNMIQEVEKLLRLGRQSKPVKNYLVIYVFTGHGVMKDGEQ